MIFLLDFVFGVGLFEWFLAVDFQARVKQTRASGGVPGGRPNRCRDVSIRRPLSGVLSIDPAIRRCRLRGRTRPRADWRAM